MKKSLIGLTIAEALKQIEKAESKSELYQVYVCTKEHKTRNMFKEYKKIHLRNENGKRVYKIYDYDLITFVKNKELQKDSFILDYSIKPEYHDNWSLNGYVNTASHNVYWLYIDGIAKGNRGREITINKTEQLIEYKDNELTKAQRRFTL